MDKFTLDDLNLLAAEGTLTLEALRRTGSISEAAQLLGVTRQRVVRLINKHRLPWPQPIVMQEVAR